MADQPVPKTISATDASNRFGTLIEEAARGRSLFIVTRMGRPQAVVIGVDQYRNLLEEAETTQEISDQSYLAGVAEAREEIRLGQTLTLEELDRELGLSKDEIDSQI